MIFLNHSTHTHKYRFEIYVHQESTPEEEDLWCSNITFKQNVWVQLQQEVELICKNEYFSAWSKA